MKVNYKQRQGIDSQKSYFQGKKSLLPSWEYLRSYENSLKFFTAKDLTNGKLSAIIAVVKGTAIIANIKNH